MKFHGSILANDPALGLYFNQPERHEESASVIDYSFLPIEKMERGGGGGGGGGAERWGDGGCEGKSGGWAW